MPDHGTLAGVVCGQRERQVAIEHAYQVAQVAGAAAQVGERVARVRHTEAPPDVESLIYAIDGSIKVRHRSQFFRWTQGGLQRLIPHETLICAKGIATRLIADRENA